MKMGILLYSFIFLCAGFCCDPEDDYAGEYYNYDIPDLISIENETALFNVGDTLWVKTSLPLNIQITSGSNVNLSQLVGGGELAYVQFSVFQKSNFDNPLPIPLSESEIVAKTGEVGINNNAVTATARLSDASFESLFGVKLKNTGRFFLASDIYNNGKPTIYLDTRNGNSVYILTSIEGVDSDNRFQFTVE